MLEPSVRHMERKSGVRERPGILHGRSVRFGPLTTLSRRNPQLFVSFSVPNETACTLRIRMMPMSKIIVVGPPLLHKDHFIFRGRGISDSESLSVDAVRR